MVTRKVWRVRPRTWLTLTFLAQLSKSILAQLIKDILVPVTKRQSIGSGSRWWHSRSWTYFIPWTYWICSYILKNFLWKKHKNYLSNPYTLSKLKNKKAKQVREAETQSHHKLHHGCDVHNQEGAQNPGLLPVEHIRHPNSWNMHLR